MTIASSSGIVGAPNIVAYGAAKAGVIHMTKTLAMELAPHGIRVNCIVPGTHLTERAAANTDPATVAFREAAAKAPPLARLGDPLETGGLAVFFASRALRLRQPGTACSRTAASRTRRRARRCRRGSPRHRAIATRRGVRS